MTLVRTTYYDPARTYGSPRVYRAIKAAKVPCSRAHVARIMRQECIWAVHKKKIRVTTDSAHGFPVAPNLLGRDFTAKGPNKKWATDITSIRTREGWLYLAVVIDLFASELYQQALSQAKMLCSMSRKGNCWDNAVTESFFSTIKRELVYPHGIFASRAEARSKIFTYIESWYNRVRKHSALQYQSPTEYEFENENVSLISAA